MAFGTHRECLRLTALLCTALIAPGELPLIAQQPAAGPAQQPAGAPQQPAAGAPQNAQQQPAADAPKLKTPEQLDSLVAPIALYPDPLLAQVLAAATYPLNVVEAQRWLKANPNLKGEDLTKAAAKQDWDASVQALVAFPQALKLLDDNIQWTTDLGNAFLDQQGDLMDAVQRMRKKAKDAGKLETTKEQKVEVKTVESKTVVEIQPASPQVIYVPSYNPTVVYGPPVYAYPPIVYPPPPSTGAVIATAAVSFGVGVMMGAMWSGCCGGGYGWGCHWGGGNNVVINNNFNTRYGYNNVNNINANRTNIGNTNRSGNSNWQHNPAHRGAVPYDSRNTAQRFGGSARDSSGRMQRYDRAGQPRANTAQADRGGFNRSAANRDAGANRGQFGAGGQDRMGDRSIGREGGRQGSAFSGSESRARTQAASDRGFASTRESGGGGRSGGGGGGSGRFGGGGGGRSFGGGGRRR
jgi:hypothetical protein